MEYLNLFGEPLENDVVKGIKKKKLNEHKKNNEIGGTTSEVMIVAGINFILDVEYEDLLKVEDINLFNRRQDDVILTCRKIIKQINKQYNIYKCIKNKNKVKICVDNVFIDTSPKSDIFFKGYNNEILKKISVKSGTTYELTSAKFTNMDYSSDLEIALVNSYGHCDWVNEIINLISYLNKNYNSFLSNLKGIFNNVKEFRCNYPKETKEIESIGNKISDIINKNFDINTECGKKFIMEFCNGNNKFGKDSDYSADGYIIVNFDKQIIKLFDNDESYYNYLCKQDIRMYCSWKKQKPYAYTFRINVKCNKYYE